MFGGVRGARSIGDPDVRPLACPNREVRFVRLGAVFAGTRNGKKTRARRAGISGVKGTWSVSEVASESALALMVRSRICERRE